jgi:hypothetical protein
MSLVLIVPRGTTARNQIESRDAWSQQMRSDEEATRGADS